jgi:hypothetical protein
MVPRVKSCSVLLAGHGGKSPDGVEFHINQPRRVVGGSSASTDARKKWYASVCLVAWCRWSRRAIVVGLNFTHSKNLSGREFGAQHADDFEVGLWVSRLVKQACHARRRSRILWQETMLEGFRHATMVHYLGIDV